MRTGARNAVAREDLSVKEALMVMVAAKSGSVAVVNPRGKLTGVFTDGDLRRQMARENEEGAALAEAGVNIEIISTSEIRITCMIAEDQVETAVRALHKAFALEEPEPLVQDEAGPTGVGGATGGTGTSATGPAQGFLDTLGNAFGQLNQQLVGADASLADFAAGGSSDLHTVMLQMQEASIGLKLGVQVRDKFIEAYQEIMRLQL